jgi:hypothetical protein
MSLPASVLECPCCGTMADRVHADGIVFRMSVDESGFVCLDEDGEIIDVVAECECGVTRALIMLDEKRHVHRVDWQLPGDE